MHQPRRTFRDTFEQAIQALRENRLRTFLSVLGVAVGVAAVVTVGTIAKSGRDFVFTELETYGLTSVWVWASDESDNPLQALPEGYEITNADIDAVRRTGCCPAVKRISPEVYYDNWEQLVRVGNRFHKAVVKGISPDWFAINNSVPLFGRLFRPDDIRQRKPVAVIGTKVQEELFGRHANALGKIIKWGENPVRVIGVLKEKDLQFLTGIGLETMDINNQIYVPYSFFQQVLASKEVHQVIAEATDLASVPDAYEQIIALLERRHQNRFQYTNDDMLTWIDNADDYLNKLTAFGVIAAFVSLIVGGLSITNIMSTSVVERTREIGIRRAIGAKRNDIRDQFLLEAIAISGLGGIIGVVLSGIASFAFTFIIGFTIYPVWWIIAMAFLIACAVGLLSGYLPAKRAAQLKPVDALRYE